VSANNLPPPGRPEGLARRVAGRRLVVQPADFKAQSTGVSPNMKLRPLHDRIIVKRLEEERKSAGGIVIPDTAAEKPSMGEVIAVGPGKTDDNGKLVPMGVKVGDKILFGKYSGQEFKMDGADYLHMREDDVIGVIA
jgi:chaperonin GroES